MGEKRAETEKKRGEKKSWLPHQRAVHLLGSRQTGWIRPERQSPSLFIFSSILFLFVFIIYHKSCVPLACFTYLDYPHSLFFIGLETMSGFSKAFGPRNACRLQSKAPISGLDSFVLEYMCTRMHPHVANREFEARHGGPQAVRLSSSSLSKKRPLHLVRPSPSAPPSLERSLPAHTSRRLWPVLFR